MIKILGTAVVAVAMLTASPAFAGGKACCAKNASNQAACANLASLNLTSNQKTKIEAWQAECTKAGCTKESRGPVARPQRPAGPWLQRYVRLSIFACRWIGPECFRGRC